MRKLLESMLVGSAVWCCAAGYTESATPGTGFGASAPTVARPLVIELFTAQGCSSCPPAEAVLGTLATRADVLALAFHVDYWDSIGWKDRFSLPTSVARQNQYVRTLQLSSAYTPQFVIDGREDLNKAGSGEIQRLLGATRVSAPVTIQNSGQEIKVSMGAATGLGECDVDLIAYQSEASTPVSRGENANRVLHEFNIVRSFRRLGDWRGTPVDWKVPVNDLPAGTDHLAVLVQRRGQSDIIGAVALGLNAPKTKIG
jgi:hypothetical protein